MLTNPIHPWNETPLSDHSTSDRARESGQDVELLFRRRSHRCEAIQHGYLINKLISSGKGRDGLHKWSSPPTLPACGRECYVCHVFDPAMRWSLTGFTAKVDGDTARSPPLCGVWNIRFNLKRRNGSEGGPFPNVLGPLQSSQEEARLAKAP